jgi:hypothetical protein
MFVTIRWQYTGCVSEVAAIAGFMRDGFDIYMQGCSMRAASILGICCLFKGHEQCIVIAFEETCADCNGLISERTEMYMGCDTSSHVLPPAAGWAGTTVSIRVACSRCVCVCYIAYTAHTCAERRVGCGVGCCFGYPMLWSEHSVAGFLVFLLA